MRNADQAPRQACGRADDDVQRIIGEDRVRFAGSGPREAVQDQRASSRFVDRTEANPAVDAVVEVALAKNARFQLALPEEDDVEQLALRDVKIEQ